MESINNTANTNGQTDGQNLKKIEADWNCVGSFFENLLA